MKFHISVLLNEIISNLEIKKNDIVLDATINGGGHSFEISKFLSRDGVLIGLDQDSEALARSKKLLKDVQCKTYFVKANFKYLDIVLKEFKIEKVNKILFDLGWNSNQFQDANRGFSFKYDGPLLMTFKKELEEDDLTAHEIVNKWNEEELVNILLNYGEERYAKKIAKAIKTARSDSPINSTFELVEIIKKATPIFYHHRKIHPATKTFQALRIAVNDELNTLSDAIEKSFELLAKDGIMAVISFHSLEDRIVKKFFKEKSKEGEGELLFKKPIIASRNEIFKNPRSRSAKLRIIRKN